MKTIIEYKFQFGLVALILMTMYAAYSVFYPHYKTVTIDSRHWECATPSTRGIDAICINYRYVGSPQDFNIKQ